MAAFVPDAVCVQRAASVSAAASRACCVFFGGDQLRAGDPLTTPSMLRDQAPEQQAASVASRYPGHDVFVVAPSRLLRDCFACFDRYHHAVTPMDGSPTGYPATPTRALSELSRVLQTTGASGAAGTREATGEADNRRFGGYDTLRVMGFSRGGAVVHQVLCEAAADDDAAAAAEPLAAADAALRRRVCAALASVHFLDAGLNVPGRCFPVEAASRLARLAARRPATAPPLQVWVHHARWTAEPNRPAVARERNAFIAALRAADATTTLPRPPLLLAERVYAFRGEPVHGPLVPADADEAEGRAAMSRVLQDHLRVPHVVVEDPACGGAGAGPAAPGETLQPLTGCTYSLDGVAVPE